MAKSFSQLNVDPVAGAEVMDALGMSVDELEDNKKFQKLQEIIGFLAPFEDKRYVIRKVLRGKAGEDRVNVLWEYINFRKEREAIMKELVEVERIPEDLQGEQLTNNQTAEMIREDKLGKLQRVEENLELYEHG